MAFFFSQRSEDTIQIDFKEGSYSTSIKQIFIVPGTGCSFAILKICSGIEQEEQNCPFS